MGELTDNSLTLIWNQNGNSVDTQYRVVLTDPSTGTWLMNSNWQTNISSWTFTGLSPATNYRGWVQSRNGNNIETSWIDYGTIQTFVVERGLIGIYYNTVNLKDKKVLRIDSNINFNWGVDSPDGMINPDTFSVKWMGKIKPLYSENYTFYTQTDDGVRLWVNGKLLIDQWHDQGGNEHSGQILLDAGQEYEIVMEYYENSGGASAFLLWSSPSQEKQVIPESQLLPSGKYYIYDDNGRLEYVYIDGLPTIRFYYDNNGNLKTRELITH